jgi:hypothetical protein
LYGATLSSLRAGRSLYPALRIASSTASGWRAITARSTRASPPGRVWPRSRLSRHAQNECCYHRALDKFIHTLGRFTVLACLFSCGIGAATFPIFFEPSGPDYLVRSQTSTLEISRNGISVSTPVERNAMRLEWAGSENVELSGTEPIHGVSNFFDDSPERWRTGVPHYSRVHARTNGVIADVDPPSGKPEKKADHFAMHRCHRPPGSRPALNPRHRSHA